MADIEQSAGIVIGGGGSSMSGNPAVRIIEDYLGLVRAHLPATIAEEVIEELRLYITEAATEIGEGTLTEKSAKKTVARFGAPSEVAEEYIASMLEDDEGTTDSAGHEMAIAKEEPSKPVKKEIMDRETVPLTNAYHKSLAVFAFWSVLMSTFTFFLAPFFIAFQLIVGFIVLTLMHKRRESKGTILYENTFREWPSYQKLLTLPEGMNTTVRGLGSTTGVITSLLCIPFLFLTIFSIFPNVFAIAAIFLIVVQILMRSSSTKTRRNTYSKDEIRVLALLLVCISFSAFVSLFQTITPAVLYLAYSFPYSTYLIIILTYRAQDYWVDYQKISMGTTTDVTLERAYEEKDEDWEELSKLQQEPIDAKIPHEEIDKSKMQKVNAAHALGKAYLIVALWWILTSVWSFMVVPFAYSIVHLLILPFILIPICWHFISLNSKGTEFYISDKIQSTIKDILSLPVNSFEKKTSAQNKAATIIYASTAVVFAFPAIFLLTGQYPNLVISLCIGLSSICLGLLSYNHHLRGVYGNQQKYLMDSIVLAFLVLVSGNLGLGFILGSHYNIEPNVVLYSILFIIPWILLSINLYYEIVRTGYEFALIEPKQEDITESAEDVDEKPYYETINLRRAVLSVVPKTISYIFFTTLPTLGYLLLVAGWERISEGLSLYTILLGCSVFSACILLLPLGFYFGFKRYISSLKTDFMTVGTRSRQEAFLDLVIIISVFTLYVLAISNMFTSDYLANRQVYLLQNYTTEMVIFLLTSEVLCLLLILMGLLVRVVSDITKLRNGERLSDAQTLIFGNRLLIIATALIISLSFFGHLDNRYTVFYNILFYITMQVLIGFLAFQITTTQVKLMEQTEIHDSEESGGSPRETTSSLSRDDKEVNERRSTLSGIIGWFIGFYFLCYVGFGFIQPSGIGYLTILNDISFMILATGFIVIVTCLAFFKVKAILVETGEAESIIGRRGSAEASIDMIVSMALLGLVVAMFTSDRESPWFNPSYWSELLVSLDLGFVTIMINLLFVLLILSLFMRVTADIMDIRNPGKIKSVTVLSVSAALTVASMAVLLFFGMIIMDSFRDPWNITFYLFTLTSFVMLQSITSWIKLKRLAKSNGKRESKEPSPEDGPPAIEIGAI